MEWNVEKIMEMVKSHGMAITQEQAAIHAHCFNEAKKRGVSPITIALEAMQHQDAEKNLGKINSDNCSSLKKPSWQL
jgi:hypothetical protein